MRTTSHRAVVAACAGLLLLAGAERARLAGPVALVRVPNGGIQPQVAIDAKGVAHVIYFQGDPAKGDLFYVRMDTKGAFSAPIQVNTQQGSALATGTMRGGHLAVGRGGRVHVAWLGSSAVARVGDSAPVMYTRLNDAGTGFLPERNVVQSAKGLDGDAIGADQDGHVYLTWHAGTAGQDGEAHRRLWLISSNDDGRTFGEQRAVSPPANGACGCCGVGALARGRDVFLLYRSATDNVHRDTYLLTSRDRGTSFSATKLHEWNIATCPMSTFALAADADGALAGWETDGQVQWTRVGASTGQPGPTVTPAGAPKTRKHPSLAVNALGEILFVWTEGTGWNKGGGLAWQRYDHAGAPLGDQGRAPGVPVWSLAAAAARPDGSFVVLY